MLENVFANMQRRVNSCVKAGEEHFEHSVILNKTTLFFIAFISFKLKRLNMRTINGTKLTITLHLFNQSIGIQFYIKNLKLVI
jgi:hypothetical protein